MSKLKDYRRTSSADTALIKPEREEPLHWIVVLKARYPECYKIAVKRLVDKHKKYEAALKEEGLIHLHFIDTRHLKELLEMTREEVAKWNESSNIKR